MPDARRQMHCKPSLWETSLCESRFLPRLLFCCCLAPIKRPYPALSLSPLLFLFFSPSSPSPRPQHQPGLRAYNSMLPLACSIKVHPLSILETAPLCCRMCGRSVCCASAARALPEPLAHYYPGPKYTTRHWEKKAFGSIVPSYHVTNGMHVLALHCCSTTRTFQSLHFFFLSSLPPQTTDFFPIDCLSLHPSVLH